MDPQVWIQVVQSLGVSAACLLALSFAIWKGIKWVGLNVIKPVADRHIKFLDDVTTEVKEMVQDNKQQGVILTEFARRMEHVIERVETVAETLADIKQGKIVLKAETVTIQPKGSNATGSDR